MRIIKRLGDTAFEQFSQGNIRVGSLSYYRGIEDAARADATEGPRPVHVQGRGDDPVTISAEEINSLATQAGSAIRVEDPNLKFNLKGKGKMLFYSDVNIFVFCASRVVDDCKDLDPKFGTNFVEITEPDRFARMVARVLSNEIFAKKAISLKGKADSISFAHREVTYQNKGSVAGSGSTSSSSTSNFPLDEAFVKPPEFEREREYRFVWLPFFNPGGTACNLPIGFKYVDINVPDLSQVCRAVAI